MALEFRNRPSVTIEERIKAVTMRQQGKTALCNEYTRYLCLNIKFKGSICCDIRELVNLEEETLSGIVETCKLEELLMRDEIRSEKENNPYTVKNKNDLDTFQKRLKNNSA
ncbi:unnamed protein product [Brachionus calyciflorus]|uniref:Uncharacterized protein n=1 Tax=Brachionus calyciflorus TaxID=104777 RepID=A0A814MTN4_9BILA|nr:unnamed protein product [Brachionus calyciflorus]